MPRLSDTGRPRVGSQLLPHGSFGGRAGARPMTRRTRAIKSRARGRLPLRRLEPEAAGASGGRFVAVPCRRGCFTNQRHWCQATTAWRATGNGRVRSAPEGLRRIRVIDLPRRGPALLALDHKQFPVRHLCETASVPSSSDAGDELDASSLAKAEETLLAGIVPIQWPTSVSPTAVRAVGGEVVNLRHLSSVTARPTRCRSSRRRRHATAPVLVQSGCRY